METFIHKIIFFNKNCELNKPVQFEKEPIALGIHFQTQTYYKNNINY